MASGLGIVTINKQEHPIAGREHQGRIAASCHAWRQATLASRRTLALQAGGSVPITRTCGRAYWQLNANQLSFGQ
jgi:hypothetical protein